MQETVVGRESCTLCAGDGTLPVVTSLDPPTRGDDALCPCAVQLMWDGRTFWANGSDGSSIARFGPAGIDIHRPYEEQIEGKDQCLDCRTATMEDVNSGKLGREHRLWPEFERSLREHHAIVIPAGFMG